MNTSADHIFCHSFGRVGSSLALIDKVRKLTYIRMQYSMGMIVHFPNSLSCALSYVLNAGSTDVRLFTQWKEFSVTLKKLQQQFCNPKCGFAFAFVEVIKPRCACTARDYGSRSVCVCVSVCLCVCYWNICSTTVFWLK